MDWKKFLSTEFVAFAALLVIATIAFFKQPVSISFVEFGGFVAALAVNLGLVRTWQKGQSIKAGANDLK